MQETDRVSVLTTSFNQAPYLAANLDSVRAQGAIIREHIVVDGASGDGSVAILRGRGDARMRWISERDRGQSDALNKALRAARGDVIGWLNSDDVYYPDAARRAVALLDANPGLGMVYGHCSKIDEAGRVIGRVDAHPVTLEDMLVFDTIPQPSCFIRRAVLERVGGVDVDLRYSMDYDLWLRIGLLGVPWLAVDEVWAGFRVHGRSKSVAEVAGFLPEIERAMERALASPALPPPLAARRAELRRRFHTYVALSAYANLHMRSARAYGLKALAAEPRRLLASGPVLRCLAKSLLGARLVVAARQARQARQPGHDAPPPPPAPSAAAPPPPPRAEPPPP